MQRDELHVICRMVASLVLLDGPVDPAGLELLDRLVTCLGLDDRDLEGLGDRMMADEAAAELASMARATREQVFALLIEAAAVDNHVGSEERTYLHHCGRAAGLEPGAVDQRIADRLTFFN